MEEVGAAMEQHMKLMADLVQKLSNEIRSGMGPAYFNLMAFFHSINWKEPWLLGLLGFHVFLLFTLIFSRKHINFHMCLFLLSMSGVYFAERLNQFLGKNWESFATQNYFDSRGVFLSVLWSGPLLIIAMLILINTLFSLCYLMVKWKRAELRHRAKISQKKDD